MVRIERDSYYMKIAEVVAMRSTCGKAQVGCVLVDPKTNRIVATGYNGSAKGAPHCIEVGCMVVDLGVGHGESCVRTVHAELNALLHLDRNYDSLLMYSTHQPCFQCWKALVTANVHNIFYINPYSDKIRDRLAEECPVITMVRLRHC